MIIAKGQDVTFNGDFMSTGTHPLVASGGDTPSPMAEPSVFGARQTPEAIARAVPQRADTPAERRIIDAARAAQARPAASSPEQVAPTVSQPPTTAVGIGSSGKLTLVFQKN